MGSVVGVGVAVGTGMGALVEAGCEQALATNETRATEIIASTAALGQLRATLCPMRGHKTEIPPILVRYMRS